MAAGDALKDDLMVSYAPQVASILDDYNVRACVSVRAVRVMTCIILPDRSAVAPTTPMKHPNNSCPCCSIRASST